MDPIIYILLLSTLAPVLGSAIGVWRKPTDSFMYAMLSFAAGVMLGISFLELIPESLELSSIWICITGIMTGAVAMYGIDHLLPHIHPALCSTEEGGGLYKTAWTLILGLGLHNLPEGMAIAIGAASEYKTGLIVALAIAIHDIPEGICTSAPYYHCTQNRLKAFLISSATAIPVVVGFLIATFLFKVISIQFVGFLVAATAGLMIFICADELIPSSMGKVSNHHTVFSLILGVVFVVLLGLI